jgi:F0F1-type ATP synthase membrane subunit b/b'
MSSQQKRGFRLPWGAERALDADAAITATLDPASPEPTTGVDSDDLGERPFDLADASPLPTTDEAPASFDLPEDTAEAAMIDTQAPTNSNPDAAGGGWPDADRRTRPEQTHDDDGLRARPSIAASGEARPARRENPLVAGLVKAMREAAVASREETISRLQTEAEARVESIRTRATTEAAELRRRAEGDIGEIREWSKHEIARIRQETEDRIDARKSELSGETEHHAESVERLVTDVQSVVETFKDDMERFFERLLAENDPARLAALAEQAPDAPDLSGDGPAAIDLGDDVAVQSVAPESVAPESVVPDSLAADAASAAEAAASEGLDMGETSEWPAAALATAPTDDTSPQAMDANDGATRLLVSGLGSVAGISSLKGAIGQLPGVHAVSVSSGERGGFVFAVTHDPGFDVAAGVTSLPGFEARVTEASEDGISVVAQEPAA